MAECHIIQKRAEVLRKNERNIVGLECMNAKIVLVRSQTYGSLPGRGCYADNLWGIHSAMSWVGKLHWIYKCNI